MLLPNRLKVWLRMNKLHYLSNAPVLQMKEEKGKKLEMAVMRAEIEQIKGLILDSGKKVQALGETVERYSHILLLPVHQSPWILTRPMSPHHLVYV